VNVDSGLIIVVLVGAVVALYTVNKLIGKGINAADRAIRHKTFEKGRAEASAGLHVTVPVPPEQCIDAIVRTVNAHERAPVVVAGLYLRDRSRTEAVFAFGSKLEDSFAAGVKLAATAEGASGGFEVLAWKESGADIHGRDEMSRLRSRVAEAVRGLGGTARQV
jgi:hypothetical protein